MSAAEQLFATRGIAVVSLREIGASAGQANTNAVQYHFGSKDGLIEALLTWRRQQVNEDRAALLERIPEGLSREETVYEGVRCLVLPLVGLLDSGRRSYFLRLLAQLYETGRWNLLSTAWHGPANRSSDTGIQAFAVVEGAVPDLEPSRLDMRRRLAAALLVGSLAAREDYEQRNTAQEEDLRLFTEELIGAISAIFLRSDYAG